MNNTISLIGGDARIVSLAELLVLDGYKVFTYGLEKAKFAVKLQENILECSTIKELLEHSKKIIGPIPITCNNKIINMPFSDKKITVSQIAEHLSNHIFILGKVSEELKKELSMKNTKIIDILDIEEFTILNIIPTVEGAIQVAMQETKRTLHGSKALILGFGRIGKLLSKNLSALGVKVACEARKKEDLAWIKAYGYEGIHLANLEEKIDKFDIIFNTIPTEILDKKLLEKVKKDVLIIELASLPGGINREIAEENGIKVVEALALPGKVAPLTVAEYIKEIIYSIE